MEIEWRGYGFVSYIDKGFDELWEAFKNWKGSQKEFYMKFVNQGLKYVKQ